MYFKTFDVKENAKKITFISLHSHWGGESEKYTTINSLFIVSVSFNTLTWWQKKKIETRVEQAFYYNKTFIKNGQ